MVDFRNLDCRMMEFDGTLRNIQLILSLMILGLCVFGGVTLLAHPRRSRAKSILGAGGVNRFPVGGQSLAGQFQAPFPAAYPHYRRIRDGCHYMLHH